MKTYYIYKKTYDSKQLYIDTVSGSELNDNEGGWGSTPYHYQDLGKITCSELEEPIMAVLLMQTRKEPIRAEEIGFLLHPRFKTVVDGLIQKLSVFLSAVSLGKLFDTSLRHGVEINVKHSRASKDFFFEAMGVTHDLAQVQDIAGLLKWYDTQLLRKFVMQHRHPFLDRLVGKSYTRTHQRIIELGCSKLERILTEHDGQFGLEDNKRFRCSQLLHHIKKCAPDRAKNLLATAWPLAPRTALMI